MQIALDMHDGAKGTGGPARSERDDLRDILACAGVHGGLGIDWLFDRLDRAVGDRP